MYIRSRRGRVGGGLAALLLVVGLCSPFSMLMAEGPIVASGAPQDFLRVLDQAAAGVVQAGSEAESYALVRDERLAMYAAAREHRANRERRLNKGARFQPSAPGDGGPAGATASGRGVGAAAAASVFPCDSLWESASRRFVRRERPRAQIVAASARSWSAKGPGALYFAIRNGYAGDEGRHRSSPANHFARSPAIALRTFVLTVGFTPASLSLLASSHTRAVPASVPLVTHPGGIV